MKKKWQTLFLNCLLILFVFFMGSVALEGAEVDNTYSELFEDQNLGRIVAAINNKGLDDLARHEELDKITKVVILDGKLSNDFQIVSIEGIGYLKNLKHLEITNNRIKEIPKEIGKLKKLNSLNLNHNEIVAIPEEIGGAYNLNEIQLNQNKIGKLPSGMGNLFSLQLLKVSHNSIEDISEDFFNMRYLKQFYIDNNKLEQLSTVGFLKLPYIEEFSCSDNSMVVDAKGLILSYFKNNLLYKKIMECMFMNWPKKYKEWVLPFLC